MTRFWVKKKLLIVSTFNPFPLREGGQIAQYFFLGPLSEYYDATLLACAKTEASLQALESLKERIPKLQIVIQCGFVANKRKAKFRLLSRLFNYFRYLFRKFKGRGQVLLNSRLKVDRLVFETGKPEFVRFVAKHLEAKKYDVVQIDFFNGLSLLPLLPAEVRKVFVHHELYFKRLMADTGIDDGMRTYLVSCAGLFEKAFLRLADVVVVFNEEDKQLLADHCRSVEISPYGIPRDLIFRHAPSTEFFRFIFLGGETHGPNREGLLWFLDTIYVPNYSSIQWPVYVFGSWSETVRVRYRQFSKIIFMGFVADLAPYFDNSVMLSPILSGSGIRTKILQALANFLPVMSTHFGAEGLSNSSDRHILFFENGDQFLDHYSSISHDHSVLGCVAMEGDRFFKSYFDEEKLVGTRLKILSPD